MTLAEPNFIARDPAPIIAEMVAWFEDATGRTLYPAQIERLQINFVAYRETLVRQAIQEAAKQNLVAFARPPMLDYLGDLVGVTRLAASAATTTLRFAVATAQPTDIAIAAGTRVQSRDGRLMFATDAVATIAAGSLTIDVSATCTATGADGNGWAPGQLASLVDDPGNSLFTVTNISQSANGFEDELDDRLRERIKLAPEAYSNAGSKGAYRFHAMSASPGIADIAVTSPTPGDVNLYPLMSAGLPDANILALVAARCSGEKVRPLSDQVAVLAPTQIDYSITAQLVLYANVDADSVIAAANTAASAYAAHLAAGLGQDIVPSQIIAALSVTGVYSVTLTTPAALVVVAPNEWAHCSAVALTVTGVTSG